MSVSGGSELVGSFAWHPFVRVFTALWLAGIASFVLIGVAGTVSLTATGHWASALKALGVTGVALGAAAVGVALVTFAGRAGIRDEQALRSWLDQRLRDDK